ncbi:hypothetical protein KR074_005129, partial [Drosophila pseudoananassae]
KLFRRKMFNPYSEELELDRNLEEVQTKLACLMDTNWNGSQVNFSAATGHETVPAKIPDIGSSAQNVLAEVQRNFRDLHLDHAPRFEFHGLECNQMHQKRMRQPSEFENLPQGSASQKKRKSDGEGVLVSDVKQQQLRKETLWNIQNRQLPGNPSADSLCFHKFQGDFKEPNIVPRLMDLFRSLHDIIAADLNIFHPYITSIDDMTPTHIKKKMPKSGNVRYQVQILSTQVEKFLRGLRNTLEANRLFSFEKYDECDHLLTGSVSYLHSLNPFLTAELRHRNFRYYSHVAKKNFQRLEALLFDFRQWLKAAHLSIHVFNWEMDLEHHYTNDMKRYHEELKERALLQASADMKAANQRSLSAEEEFIASHYQLQGLVQCAKDHDNFLSAVLVNPENYFPSHIVAMCARPKNELPGAVQLQAAAEAASNFDWRLMGVMAEPSSPPRQTQRPAHPVRFRS